LWLSFYQGSMNMNDLYSRIEGNSSGFQLSQKEFSKKNNWRPLEGG
jgi:hypothetical protein